MSGLRETQPSLSQWPRFAVDFTGGKDQIVSGPVWGSRSRELRLSYRVSARRDTPTRRATLGSLNLRRVLSDRIARFEPPQHVSVTIHQSPVSRLGMMSRTLAVTFSVMAPWEQPIPTGRQLWASVPIDIRCLQRLIHDVVEEGVLPGDTASGSVCMDSRRSKKPSPTYDQTPP